MSVSPSPLTPRLGLPRPSLHDPMDVPKDLEKLTDRLDELVAPYLAGAANVMPQPGIPGRLFFVTPAGPLLFDTGTSWVEPGYTPGDLKVSAAAAAVPAGWLVCNGQAVARAQFPDLFAVIGTAWGAGDGSSTFNVPDLRGRALMGAGTAPGMTARTVGQRIGSESEALTTAQMPYHGHGYSQAPHGHGVYDPSHGHSGYTGGHSHSVGNLASEAQASLLTYSGGLAGHGAFTSPGVGLQGTSWAGDLGVGAYGAYTGVSIYGDYAQISFSAEGGNQAHNNVGPSAVVNILIKT